MLVGTCVVAVLVPWLLARHAHHRVREELQPAWSAALGETVEIGSVQAELTGSVRLERVAIGGVFGADAIEGSVGLETLLSGRLTADEIRIESPWLRTRVDDSGDTQLNRLVRRAAAARARRPASASSGARRLRRIVVTGGELRVDLEGRGTLVAHDVALHPQRGGVRVVAGAIDLDLHDPRMPARARFHRAAADVELPGLAVRRAIAVDGTAPVQAAGAEPVGLFELVIARGIDRPGAWIARGRGADARSRVALRAEPRADGGTDLALSATRAPLAPLAAFVPAGLRTADAAASGTATVTLRPTGGAAVRFDLQLDGVVVAHDRVAAEPLPLSGTARGSAELRRDGDAVRIAWTDVELRPIDDVAVRTRGTVDLLGGPMPYRGELVVELPRTSCMRALAAVPEPARRRLRGLDLRGTVAARVALAFDGDRPDATRLDVALDADDCDALREAETADPRVVRRPFEHAFPDGTYVVIGPGRPGHVAIDALPRTLVGMFVAAEDARFYTHDGFDAHQIERSLAIDLAEGELVRGGSTISQQLVKNLFLDRRRTFARKLEELVLTWRLEHRLDKREILEAYLNIIELGRGVYGVHAAAGYWFGKAPKNLSVVEMAFLAAMTPAPIGFSRRIEVAGGLDDVVRQRVQITLRAARLAGVITEADYQRAVKAPLALRGPLLALHAQE